ncbi:DUF3425 domain protein [Pleurostoma richardsiae]|uniref:DUF3425 domain protein n=1 Tax=Pleurostoma richardsiae TaxID=41990 RepID=A0AA38R3D7_9PEZI|nr:DUF3425 domain protein [Pleurostoma richardsiae]
MDAVPPLHPSSNSTSTKPKTRQRIHKPPTLLKVPNINDDAPERKRILNVLAQRRYRERKRQSRASAAVELLTEASSRDASVVGTDSSLSEHGAADGSRSPEVATTEAMTVVEPLNLDLVESWDAGIYADLHSSCTYSGVLGILGDGPVPTEASSSSASSTSPSLPPTIDPSRLLDPALSLGDTTAPPSFLDSYYLPMPELTLLRAFLRIATRFNCPTSIWDLNACSPFCPASPSSPTGLPCHWQPTPSQLLVPHHPLLDMLPWPSVRDKLITVLFGLPPELSSPATRPPALGGGTTEPGGAGAVGGALGSVAQLAYDMEDAAEGMRLWGANPCDPGAWEIGQVLFERWWFVFDRAVVEQSNRWRQARGAARLCLPGGKQKVSS